MSCDPCTVPAGGTSRLTADARDPDGDPLTFTWTAPSGTLAPTGGRQTTWTSPQTAGIVPVTVTADDGRGHRVSEAVNLTVTAADVSSLTFDDVYFDFDRAALRGDSLTTLQAVVNFLRANPTMRIEIDGHTCNIGTTEYNLALGERRAVAVRQYLISAGIAATRLSVRSYGEDAPRHANDGEDTRRLNRRAAFIILTSR